MSVLRARKILAAIVDMGDEGDVVDDMKAGAADALEALGGRAPTWQQRAHRARRSWQAASAIMRGGVVVHNATIRGELDLRGQHHGWVTDSTFRRFPAVDLAPILEGLRADVAKLTEASRPVTLHAFTDNARAAAEFERHLSGTLLTYGPAVPVARTDWTAPQSESDRARARWIANRDAERAAGDTTHHAPSPDPILSLEVSSRGMGGGVTEARVQFGTPKDVGPGVLAHRLRTAIRNAVRPDADAEDAKDRQALNTLDQAIAELREIASQPARTVGYVTSRKIADIADRLDHVLD